MSDNELPPVVRIEIQVPRRLYERLQEVARRLGIEEQDIIARAILKVIEEFGG